MESENVSQKRYWRECVCAAVDLAARLPADNNSSPCETCLMSELSPRLQPVTTSFDNSLRRRRETPRDTRLSAERCPWQPQASRAYSNSIDTSHSACIQSPHSTRLISHSLFPSVSLSLPVCHSQSLCHYNCVSLPRCKNLHLIKSFLSITSRLSIKVFDFSFRQIPEKDLNQERLFPTNMYCLCIQA